VGNSYTIEDNCKKKGKKKDNLLSYIIKDLGTKEKVRVIHYKDP